MVDVQTGIVTTNLWNAKKECWPFNNNVR